MKSKHEPNYRAWEHNAFQFLREKGLEIEFSDWCGGFPCPVTEEIDHLRAAYTETLEALKLAEEFLCICDDPPPGAAEHCLAKIREARAKHEGTE